VLQSEPTTPPPPDPWVEEYSREEAVQALMAPKKTAIEVLPTLKEVKKRLRPPKPVAEAVAPAAVEVEPAPAVPAPVVTAPAVPDDGRMRMDHWLSLGLDVSGSHVIPNINNASKLIAHLHLGEIWYDEFLQKILTSTGNGPPREWTDADDIRLTIQMQQKCGCVKMGKLVVADAVVEAAYRDVRNELQDWLKSLKWDGIMRLNDFMEDVCGCEGSTYSRAVGRNFFIGMVARAMRPGCKLDTMVVFEGRQGTGKSTLLEILAGKWYCIMRDVPESKDFGITLQGKWLVEIAELDAFSRSDVKATKRTLSTATDRYRKPYGIHAEDHPRMSVFAGSTNRDDYLADDTGERRFYPVATRRIRLDIARDNREQYFAEAMSLLSGGATWWEIPAEDAKSEQSKRAQGDVWDDAIEFAVKGLAKVTLSKVLLDIGIETGRQTRADQLRAGSCLRRLGWNRIQEWMDGRNVKQWVRSVKPGDSDIPLESD